MFNMNSEIFWNKLVLPPPQIRTYKMCDDKPKNVVQKLLNLCKEIAASLNGNDSLNMEAATLSRLIYRVKSSLRRDKGLQAMIKVNRCLIQYLNVNILSELSVISKQLSDEAGPSRQMLEWFLVRLQGLAQLFHRICKTCFEAADHLTLRIKIGHLWYVALIALANMSRIWTISQYMVQSVYGWYGDLYSYLDKLKPAPEQWLPEGYILPQDLVKFLGEPSYLVKKQSKIASLTVFPQLVKDDKDETESFMFSKQHDTFNCVFGMSEDMGEQISRDQINRSDKRKAVEIEDEVNGENTALTDDVVPQRKKKTKATNIQKEETTSVPLKVNKNNIGEKKIVKKSKEKLKVSEKNKSVSRLDKSKDIKNIHQISGILCYSDLVKFIKIEQRKRSSNTVNKQCLTKNMDNFQFQMFSNFINKYLKKMKSTEDSEQLKQVVNKLHREMCMYLSN